MNRAKESRPELARSAPVAAAQPEMELILTRALPWVKLQMALTSPSLDLESRILEKEVFFSDSPRNNGESTNFLPRGISNCDGKTKTGRN
jgi:hypothetical protein